MRWFWIDRFTEFASGSRAVAIKNVSLAEEHLHDYFPGYPIMPASLIVEGIAQTGGLLVGEYNRFEERVVLAKVSRAQFHFYAVPGHTLTYTATVEDIKPDGAIVRGTSHLHDRLQAEVELFFAHLDHRIEEELFEPADFLRMLRVFRLFDVGRNRDGGPLEIPQHLLEAERASSAAGAIEST
jgi:3-hydroxyacyl-[acyl-carrier-protein] dehydratase